MPGALRRVSRKVVAPSSWMVAWEMVVIDCGVSSSGTGYRSRLNCGEESWTMTDSLALTEMLTRPVLSI